MGDRGYDIVNIKNFQTFWKHIKNWKKENKYFKKNGDLGKLRMTKLLLKAFMEHKVYVLYLLITLDTSGIWSGDVP